MLQNIAPPRLLLRLNPVSAMVSSALSHSLLHLKIVDVCSVLTPGEAFAVAIGIRHIAATILWFPFFCRPLSNGSIGYTLAIGRESSAAISRSC
jgi:hypothetical protein